MSNITFPADAMCAAVNHTTGADCTSKGKHIALISVNGSNAYLTDNSEATAAPVCGRHLNLLKAGKSIRLTNVYLSTTITKENNTMNGDKPCNDFDNTIFPVENGFDERICHNCGWKESEHCDTDTTKEGNMNPDFVQEQYDIANMHADLDSTFLPLKGFEKCDACTFVCSLPHIPAEERGLPVYHRNTTITKEKDMTIMAPTEDNRKPIKGAVKCGHCGNYHATVDQVRACYGAPVIEKKVYVHKKIDTNKYFPTRVEAVRCQIAVKGGKVEYVEGKGWHVTPLHNS